MNLSDLPAPTPPDNQTSLLKMLGNLLVWIALPLVLGWWLATTRIPQPAVGIIHLESDIWAGSAQLVKMQIDEARTDPQIKAIVLVIDSPGGEVAPTQDMFMEILSLREVMPVVGSINSMAASGGFYLAMATEPIYAKPNSTIGNVGVWGFVPSDIGVNEVVLASGPFKLTADNSDEFLRNIEAIKQEFIATVQLYRGDRLVIAPTEISQGLAYSGRQALAFGMIDTLGSQADAAAQAADMAGIANYSVIDLQDRVLEELFVEAFGSAPGAMPAPAVQAMPALQDPASPAETVSAGAEAQTPWMLQLWLGAADPVTGQRILAPGIYLLYDVRLGGAK